MALLAICSRRLSKALPEKPSPSWHVKAGTPCAGSLLTIALVRFFLLGLNIGTLDHIYHSFLTSSWHVCDYAPTSTVIIENLAALLEEEEFAILAANERDLEAAKKRALTTI